MADRKKRPARRGRAPLPDAERKDRLVQARVDEELDAALRQEARKKRLSVSQLIRNVLEDTFDLVDNIVAETASLTQTVRRDAQRIADSAKGRVHPPDAASASAAALRKVDAWQEVTLNRGAECARCGDPLRSGQPALLGIQADPGAPRLWLCRRCRAHL